MRTIVVAIALFLLLSWPLVTIADKPMLVFGLPVLYFHIFLNWGVAIALFAWVVHRRSQAPK